MEKEPISKISGYYDQVYSKDTDAIGGGIQESFVMNAAELIPKDASVVEFGAGQGRNSIALAEQGFNVKAIEISEVGVNSMNKIAEEKSLTNFRAEVGDARDSMEGEHDLIVSTLMLHHFKKEEAEDFIRKIKEHTKIGGLNVITTFTVNGDFSKLAGQAGKFYPALGEMKNFYLDWEVIDYAENKSEARATKPDGAPMFNIDAKILARKPKQKIGG